MYTYVNNTKIADIPASDFLVIRLRFERRTHSLEGCCSIQLSYRTIFPKVLQRYAKTFDLPIIQRNFLLEAMNFVDLQGLLLLFPSVPVFPF